MRAEKLAVEPDVGGEKSGTDPREEGAGRIGARELRAIPDGLASLARRQLARHLDRLPAGTPADGQPLGFALAKGHPHRLPRAQLADARRTLRQRQEQAVAQCKATNAPSAVAHKTTGLPLEVS